MVIKLDASKIFIWPTRMPTCNLFAVAKLYVNMAAVCHFEYPNFYLFCHVTVTGTKICIRTPNFIELGSSANEI